MADRDDLDQLLDAALSTYADPGPNLAPRVLAQVSARAAARLRRLQWLWGTGLATTAAVALLLLLIAPWRAPQQGVAPHTEATVVRQPHPVLPAEASHFARPSPERAHRMPPERPLAVSVTLPKEQMFPAPRPLSVEEQALVHLVVQSTPDERRDILAAQQQSDAPLRISAISIPPIQPPAEGKE